jgi:D-xylose transport system permease protein
MAATDAPVDSTVEAMPNSPREFLRRFTQGEFGSLRVLLILAVIWIIFTIANDRFLTALNLTNLTLQIAATGMISIGVVLVLLLGEIDLSVGVVSGLCSAIMAVLNVKHGWPAVPALVAGIVAGTLIGLFQGYIHTTFGIPSFVVTLAGLLGWQGVVLLLIGDRGTVTLQDSTVVGFANDFLPAATSWVVLLACVGVYAATQVSGRVARRRAGLPTEPDVLILARVLGLLLVGAIIVAVANDDRGIPYVFVVLAVLYLIWTFVLARTKFGRYVYAVGGSQEAARRAGINVDRIKITVFAICSAMAALGGIILASRLRSVDTGAGGGQILLYSIAAPVIGGTSLFGGRGHIKSAVLGALVIASIDNGLGLLGLSSGTKFVITGLVLLLAVTVDSLSRRRQAATGRA